jgi:hypothetical protein
LVPAEGVDNKSKGITTPTATTDESAEVRSSFQRRKCTLH